MKKVNKIKKTTKKVVKTVKKAGTKVINKATSKIKTVGKKANAIIAAGKEAAAKAKKEKADRKAAAKEALCKNQEFLESQKKGYSDPTYDYKNGYPRPGEAWAFDANGNIDKEKSAEVAEKMGFWSSIAVGFIPGPLEIVLGKVAGTIVVKVGGKVGSKIISWGATKFGAKGAAKTATKEASEIIIPKATDLKNSNTVQKHIEEIVKKGANKGQLSRPYIDTDGTTLLLDEIMNAASPVKDSVLSNGLRWDVEGVFRNSKGTWELVVDMSTNTIVHFNFVN
ncbi:hypothetical protein ACOUWG_001918 [Listeria monocytogenes]